MRWRNVPWLGLVGLMTIASVAGATIAGAVQRDGSVHVVQIADEIDLGLAPYLDRALREAEEAGAAAVLLEVDTPGGRLDAVLQMQSSLIGAQVPTIAFVDRMALSAGALITIAAGEIYMAPGSTLGAATPVMGDTGELASEKTISAVRGTFRATAEARGRDPAIAEAMVDPGVEVEGLIASGSLLTFGPEQAIEWGYAEGIVVDRREVLAAAGLTGADIVETSPSLAESLVRFLTNPVLASILITIAMWLLIADLTSGGVGLPTVIAVVLFGVFFFGHLLAGLTGLEDIALVALGLGLIALELLVFPGIGIVGVLGLAAVLGGLFMAQLSRDLVTGAQMRSAALSIGLMFLGVLAGLVLAVQYLTRRGPPRALVLDAKLGSGGPVTERATGGWLRWFGGRDLVLSSTPDEDEEEPGSLAGRRGVALSDLRPSGVADIGGERVDVVTTGEYISAGEDIEIVRDEGYRRVVRRPAREPT